MAGAQGEVTTPQGLEPGRTTVRRTLPLRGRYEHTRARGPLPCDVQRPSVSVAPRLTVTADTARLSGAPQAAARPKIGGTAGSPRETRAMWGPLAAGRSARGGGPRALGDASRVRVRCCPGVPGSPRATASSRQSAARASWLRDPRPRYLLASRGGRLVSAERDVRFQGATICKAEWPARSASSGLHGDGPSAPAACASRRNRDRGPGPTACGSWA